MRQLVVRWCFRETEGKMMRGGSRGVLNTRLGS
jgi:hypothetical protein